MQLTDIYGDLPFSWFKCCVLNVFLRITLILWLVIGYLSIVSWHLSVVNIIPLIRYRLLRFWCSLQASNNKPRHNISISNALNFIHRRHSGNVCHLYVFLMYSSKCLHVLMYKTTPGLSDHQSCGGVIHQIPELVFSSTYESVLC